MVRCNVWKVFGSECTRDVLISEESKQTRCEAVAGCAWRVSGRTGLRPTQKAIPSRQASVTRQRGAGDSRTSC